MGACSEKCWTPVVCEVCSIEMPPAGRSASDTYMTCAHQHGVTNTRHLWDRHDSSRSYTDPEGWEMHVDECQRCRVDYRGEEEDDS